MQNLPRLLAAAKEFNIGQDTLIDFLEKKGFSRVDLKPTARLSQEQYDSLETEFDDHRLAARKANQIELPRAMENDTDDIIIANVVKIILENKSSKKPMLDLGKCGLRDKHLFPGGRLDTLIGDCQHITALSFRNKRREHFTEIESKNTGANNYLTMLPACIFRLKSLSIFHFGGDSDNPWPFAQCHLLNDMPRISFLDLSHNKISKVDPTDFQLDKLKMLALSGNLIQYFNITPRLTRLKTLLLDHNQLTRLDGIENLVSLQNLFAEVNNLKSFPAVTTLRELRRLVLGHNKLSSFTCPINSFRLQMLYLDNNQLNEINLLYRQTQLQYLNLSNNSSIPVPDLSKLQKLVQLSLSGTGITDLEKIKELNTLEFLQAANNKLTYIDGIFTKMSQLSYLDLSDNGISNITDLNGLTNLKTLDLSNNSISDVSSLADLELLENVSLESNPVLNDIPESVTKVGWLAIKDYLKGIQTVVSFNDVKVLLLGNTNVGKSNLLEYLETCNQPMGKHSTHGIAYKRLEKRFGDINIHVWDFGGQEFFHATHQLFFSEGALHIILWSKNDVQRDDDNPEACFDRDYWIRCIQMLIPNDSVNKIEVIVAENKIDLQQFIATAIEQISIVKKYPTLLFNFCNINLVPLKRTKSFLELMEERIYGLVRKQIAAYLKYYELINDASIDYIEINTFPVDEQKFISRAMQVFHNMGMLLFFPSILPDKVFTKPQLLLNLIYKDILGTERKSEINLDDVESAISGNSLQLSLDEVVNLLKSFDLVFQIPDSPDSLFVPQYLPEAPAFLSFFHGYQFKKSANILIESDGFLMNVAMLKLFSKYGEYIGADKKKQHFFWKDGMIIKKDSQILLISFDRQKQRILLFPDMMNGNRSLQIEIVNFILNVPNMGKEKSASAMPPLVSEAGDDAEEADHDKPLDINITFKETIAWSSDYFSVFVSLDGMYFANWKKICNSSSKGIFQIEVYLLDKENETERLPTKTLSVFDFNMYLPNESKGQMKKVFISYSKDDLKLVNKFQEHLAALKKDGKIATWYCSELKAGSDWNHEIQEHFDNADIVCFMISSSFMNTPYIHEHEIKRAFEKREKHLAFIIVPIILDFCKWSTKTNDLSQFTALPYTAKPVLDFKNQNMAWYLIQECLRLAIEINKLPGEDLYTNESLPKDVLKLYQRIMDGNADA